MSRRSCDRSDKKTVSEAYAFIVYSLPGSSRPL
jgi:hypothetical protein